MGKSNDASEEERQPLASRTPTRDPAGQVHPRGIAQDAEAFDNLVQAPQEDVHRGLSSKWLYQTEAGIFGPISAKELLELLYTGGINRETLVGPEAGEFRELRRYAVFQSHLGPAIEALERRKAARAEAEEAINRQWIQRRRWGVRVALGVLLGSALTYGGVRWHRLSLVEAAKARQQRAIEAEMAKLLEEVQIEPPLMPLFAEKSSLAAPSNQKARRKVARRRVDVPAPRRRPSAIRKRRRLSDDEVLKGMSKAFPRLVRCIKSQLRRDAKLVPPTIVLRFSISNEGRASDVDLNDRFLRRTPMLGCVRESLKLVRWRSYKGQVRNVDYPIVVRRPE